MHGMRTPHPGVWPACEIKLLELLILRKTTIIGVLFALMKGTRGFSPVALANPWANLLFLQFSFLFYSLKLFISL
jgi:hypothetical protein